MKKFLIPLKSLIILLLIFFSILSINQCYAREVFVGESYGDGTVFCVSKTEDIKKCVTKGSGDYGLIMANEDQVNLDSNANHGVHWSSTDSQMSGARSDDNGAANTAAIIAAFPNDNAGNNAAWLSHNYKDRIEGHEDWYLPSKNELNKMYVYAHANNLIGKGCAGSKAGGVQCLVGGYGDANNIYWSSTQHSGDDRYAWSQDISNGSHYYDKKNNFYLGVRAVRAFNNLTIQQFNHLFLGGHSISISYDTTNKDKQQVTAIGIYRDESTLDITELVTWKSTNPNVINIGKDGTVTSNQPGTARIYATLDGITSPKQMVTIIPHLKTFKIAELKSIAISSDTVKQQVTAIGTYFDGSILDITEFVTWQSSNPNVINIGKDGTVTSNQPGTTCIYAKLDGTNIRSPDQMTTIIPRLEVFKIGELDTVAVSFDTANKDKPHVTAIGTYRDKSTLDITELVTWRSDNTDVINIGKDGTFTSNHPGMTRIYAALDGIASPNQMATIIPPGMFKIGELDTIDVSFDTANKDKPHVTAIGTYPDKSTLNITELVTWKSTNPNVINIDKDGTVTSNQPGTARIDATLVNRVSPNQMITIIPHLKIFQIGELDTIDVSFDTANKDKRHVTATGTYRDESKLDITGLVTWQSSNTDVINIGKNGTFTSNQLGKADISATLDRVSSPNQAVTMIPCACIDYNDDPHPAQNAVIKNSCWNYCCIKEEGKYIDFKFGKHTIPCKT